MNRRHTERSSSEERPRTRTYRDHNDSNLSDYSDDFEPDTKSRNRTPPRRRKSNDKPRRKDASYYSDHSSTSYLHSSATSKVSMESTQLKRTKQKKPRPRHGWRSHNSHLSKNEPARRRPDTITARMLSAKQRKINEMQNELAETEHTLQSIQKENKLLKTVQHRQDKALRKFQDVESDLPRLISQNFEDQRVLKARLKKAQEAEKLLEEKLHENNDEMQRMEKTLRKLKKVVYDKNLGERSELARQLTTTENNLTATERKCKELEKKLELTTSSFTRQIKSERQKHKETKEKLSALEEDHQSVQARLKEKERALNNNNIYFHRKHEHSYTSSNASSPRKPLAITSSETQTDIELSNSYRTNSPLSRTPTKVRAKQIKAITGKKDDEILSFDRRPEKSESPTLFSPTHRSRTVSQSNSVHSSIKSERPKDQRRNKNEETMFITSNHRSVSPSPNNSVVADSIEVQSESDKRKSDEMKAVQEAEKEQKLLEERNRLAEQQRKTALLAKMREIEQDDAGLLPLETSKNVEKESSYTPSFDKEASKETTQFSASAKPSKTVNMHPKSKAELVKSLLGNESDTDPVVENLHMGLPSNSKKPDKPVKEMSFGGYAPSVGTTQASRKPQVPDKQQKKPFSDSDNDEPMFDLDSGKQNKKSDLLAQLFGDQEKAADSGSKPLNINTSSGSLTPRAKPVHSGYPWEKNVVTTNGHVPNKGVRNIAVKATTSFHEDDIEELAL